jgi:stage III sporulation protein AH
VAQQEDSPIISLSDEQTPGEEAELAKTVEVSAESTESFNYFIEARLQREKARSAQKELLRELIDNPNSDEEVRKKAQHELLQLSRVIGREAEVEELIRAKGFRDVLVYLRDGAAVVVIRTQALTGEEVARIADIVNRFAGVPLQAMSIIPKPQ